MNAIGPDTIADLFFQLTWESTAVRHTDAYAGRHINFWRDLLPSHLYQSLLGKHTGDEVRIGLKARELIDSASPDIVRIKRHQFEPSRIENPGLEPYVGRFYPKGVLKDVPGIFKANIAPFRCIDINNGHLDIDLGHPLADKTVDLKVIVGTVRSKLEERGGGLHSWGDTITQGVGMQARCKNTPTDFWADHFFERRDNSPDSFFYAKPRLVHHIDDTAADMVRQIHTRFLKNHSSVLDLMSSWQTHIPDSFLYKKICGLGMNAIELQNNKGLSDYVVHDLNESPTLPFDNSLYNTVICSLSVEYLVRPLAVFEEVARVLKPGGYFVVTFSNRWFEPKSIRLWTQLHEFERMGLVLEYFRHKNLFEDLNTYSIRGLERPHNDKYARQFPFSDPIYAVWGRRR